VKLVALGTELGAAYKPFALIVPTELFPPVTLFTVQVTVELKLPVPRTFGLHCEVKPACIGDVHVGVTEVMVDGGGLTPPPPAQPQPSAHSVQKAKNDARSNLDREVSVMLRSSP
jgi:hypothetical protein